MRKSQPLQEDLLAGLGYEPRDIALSTILRWVAFLFVFIFATLILSLGIYRFFVPAATEIGKSSPLLYQRTLPPNPQLQAYPKRDMMVWRQAEDALIAGKTKDPATGRPVMNVNEAIDRLAERGIAGIKGTKVRERGPGYPGSGLYGTGEVPADNTGANDTTSPETSNKASQNGSPGASGTQGGTLPGVSEQTQSPGGSMTNAGEGGAQNEAARGAGQTRGESSTGNGGASDPAANGGRVPAPTGGANTAPSAPPGPRGAGSPR